MKSFESLEIRLRIPDLWQQQALASLRQGKDVVVHAPTGAGKTYLVELLFSSNFKKQIVHSVPTRALANDKLREWKDKGWRVGIVTGDLSVDGDAPLVVATLETQKLRFIEGEGPDLFVVDEYQMLGDSIRGINYELTIAMAPPQTRLLLLSGSVSNPEAVVDWLKRMGRDPVLVKTDDRPVPLEEVRLETMNFNPPKSVKGFWPRLMARALMGDLGPILLFAPKRSESEKLAKHLAAALPIEAPLSLSAEQKRLAGRTLEKLLVKRVAFHHSGLSYQQRAGLVEPLAKAGQLRVVVSTTGLAAGVNFSMRSVLVTSGEYQVDHVQQLLRPDELLQMFGRAGRRGLDEVGYALAVSDKPRLRDARPLPTKRPAIVDWPSLLGIMAVAHDRGVPPFQAAADACFRLFSREPVAIGVERSLLNPEMPCGLMIDASRARHARADKQEMLNTAGEWEPLPEATPVPLENVRQWEDSKFVPFLSNAESVRDLGAGGLVAMGSKGEKRFGKRSAIAFRDRGSESVYSLAGWFRRSMATRRKVSLEDIPKKWEAGALGELELDVLTEIAAQGQCVRSRAEGKRWVIHFDMSAVEFSAHLDAGGIGITNPQTREALPAECRSCDQLDICGKASIRRSPALAWEQLKLMEPNGVPTLRGRVFSFFNGGEGLAIAAALEESSYSVDAIVIDIANLRAGFRFDDHSQFSHRLARSCRLAFRDRSYDGYLKHGLPLQYGEGAAEVIASSLSDPKKSRELFDDRLKPGDLQRVRLEWQSLLRQIVNAPDLDWDRWLELKRAVMLHLDEERGLVAFDSLPPLEPRQQQRVNHRLRFPRM
mgnify:CR=1 FL=1